MQTYNSTRQVQAAKIKAITPLADTGSTNLHFEGERFEGVNVAAEFMERHKPEVGGYFVRYVDGYTSFCPAEAFERDHQPVDENETAEASDGLSGPTPGGGQVGNSLRDRAEQAAQEAKWEEQQRQEQAVTIRNNALAFALNAELTAEQVVKVAATYEQFLTGQGRGVQALRDQIAIQSSPGNFDANEYMLGMANGLILALSNFTGEEPQFHDAPPSA